MTAAEPRKCVLLMYRYFLKLLSLLGFNLDSYETAADFSKRLITNYSGDMNAFAAITDIFMKARYSINEMSEDEKAEYVKFLDYLLSETESRLGKYRFMLMKYILGII